MFSVTCPGVRALTGWDSEIHKEPSRFSVTVHGAGIKKYRFFFFFYVCSDLTHGHAVKN